MNAVSDGTCNGLVAGREVRIRDYRLPQAVYAVGVGLALLVVSGCQATPTFRGQSPEFPQEITDHGTPEFERDADELLASPPVEEAITEIRIEGNATIETDAIMKYVSTQIGRPATPQQVKEDLRKLYATRWFFSVEPRYRRAAGGVVLTFRVVERPMVTRVEYRGNKRVKTKYLAGLTGIKKGSAFDVSANRESVRRMKEYYREKGFPDAEVRLFKGDSKDDREVIFEISEGKKIAVTKVKFIGNEFARNGVLKTKLRTKVAILGVVGGKFDPSTIPDDIQSLKQYYHGMGFFDAQIDYKTFKETSQFNPIRRGDTNITIEYTIKEGARFKLRKVEITGNQVFSEDELKREFKLKSGEYFSASGLNSDVDGMQDRYGQLGRLFAKVDAVPRFLEQPGMVDLVYRIDEDRVYRVRRINVHIQGDNPHTREAVVRNRILIHPGELGDAKLIKRSERRLEGQIFERGPGVGPRVQISRVKQEENLSGSVVRGQNFEPVLPQPPNPIFDNNPYGDPFGRALAEPPSEIDLDFFVNEARTGRLMFGMGVNSNAGVVGSIVLEENNFDILRPPTSFQSLADGTAWRGAGQKFRMEAVPGNIVSRYLISWSDPYFLDTNYSVGVSGFYYNRFFPDWNENRVGGRVSVGKQLTNTWSLSGALRLESVELTNPTTPTPPILTQALGNSYFSSVRGSLTHDTRDAPFLPADGHLVQLSFEQAYGDFVYPRAEIQGRQYFTVFKRADGGGRHIVTVRAQAGWTGQDTPIFERFYAGGFQSFRGFAFRGVSPRELGVAVGGRWMFLGSAEYTVPVTADENISAVAFTDFGTIEQDTGFDAMRVSVGVGLRLTVPAMGPAPIALDWAVPLADQQTDNRRLFSFYVGLTR